MLAVFVAHRGTFQELKESQLEFGSKQLKYLFNTKFNVVPAVKCQSNDQVKMHFNFLVELLNDGFCFLKVLLPAYLQVGLLVNSLDADLKPEEPFWHMPVDEF